MHAVNMLYHAGIILTIWYFIVMVGVDAKAIDFSEFSDRDQVDPYAYFVKYGYMDGKNKDFESQELLSNEVMTDAIEEFQAFAGLEVTGELDNETQSLMNEPRCGVQDDISTDKRMQRYVLAGSRWRKNVLKWRSAFQPCVRFQIGVGQE